ncbi:MAG TPA: hypothetical protein VGC88_12980, partial [Terriglobales bacterium]
MMITLIEDVEVFSPEPLGRQSVVVVGEKIARVGDAQVDALKRSGLDALHINGTALLAVPGLIDPHQHLIGGSGESGYATQTPEIFFSEIVGAGITTVVGCLGVDTVTRTMPALLAKAKGLSDQGLSAYIWSGGYDVPPVTLTGSLQSDILYVEEVIGAGEIALSDRRSSQPSLQELAHLVSEVYVGGMLTNKAGVTHFHMGDGAEKLGLVRRVLSDFPISPESVYPTHVERTCELFDDAIELTSKGVYVDVDTFEEDLAQNVSYFLEKNGNPERLTASTDAAINSPHTLLEGVRQCVRSGISLECAL